MQLRPYQQEAISAVFAAVIEGKNPLITLPTGTGKTVIFSEICRQCLAEVPGIRILIVTHLEDLVRQAAEKLMSVHPLGIGVMCAGMRKKEWNTVTVCSVQTLAKNIPTFPIDLVIIDEAHMVPRLSGSVYQLVINKLRKRNDRLVVLGCTATPYRLDSGLIYGPGEIWPEVTYSADLQDMIDLGYLCPVRVDRGTGCYDLSTVRTLGSDYNESDLEAVTLAAVEATCTDALPRLEGRLRVLVFCTTIHHAEAVASCLRSMGETAETLTSDDIGIEQAARRAMFTRGEVRFLVSVMKLAVGFDEPLADAGMMLRPTQSRGLYVQMVGRLLRTAPGKADALLLDYAGNGWRHGPIDLDYTPSPKKERDALDQAEPTLYECDSCGEVMASRRCPSCGWERPKPVRRVEVEQAAPPPVLKKEAQEPFDQSIQYISSRRNNGKNGKPDTLCVVYGIYSQQFRQWICFDHPVGSWARNRAEQWWRKVTGGAPAPVSVQDALDRFKLCKTPNRITLRGNDNGYYDVLDVHYDELPVYVPAVVDVSTHEDDSWDDNDMPF